MGFCAQKEEDAEYFSMFTFWNEQFQPLTSFVTYMIGLFA